MRYSAEQPVHPVENMDSLPTARFLSEVTRATAGADRRAAIVLVGGSDFRAVALRRAQACVRFDLRASYWSHAALVLDWPDDNPARIKGLEVALEPDVGARHLPETNGVTPFSLARYANEEAYPNLCIAVTSPVDTTRPSWRDDVLSAANAPNSGRPQYAFYAWLAEWVRHAMIPALSSNPLQANVPLPSAAFVDFAYASARVNLLPSATSANAVPEHLWSTFHFWTKALSERVGLRVFRRVMDKRCGDALEP